MRWWLITSCVHLKPADVPHLPLMHDNARRLARSLPLQASAAASPDLISLTEGGDNGTFTVSLGAQPTSSVTITLASNNSDVAVVSPTTLTFDPATYATPQTVTVAAVDNALAGGPTAALITLTTASSDGAFQDLAVNQVTVVVTNDDTVSSPGRGLLPHGACVVLRPLPNNQRRHLLFCAHAASVPWPLPGCCREYASYIGSAAWCASQPAWDAPWIYGSEMFDDTASLAPSSLAGSLAVAHSRTQTHALCCRPTWWWQTQAWPCRRAARTAPQASC